MELEKLRLEIEAKKLDAETDRGQASGLRSSSLRAAATTTRPPELPSFKDGKDDLDSYLLRFERYATVAEWKQECWATQLSALLSGKALDVYSRLSQEEALNYDMLKVALLNRYNFTESGYRQRFRSAKPDNGESPGQFVVCLKNYLSKWIELSKTEKSFAGVVDLLVQEQFTNSCSKDLSVYLLERNLKSLKELAKLAEQYQLPTTRNCLKKMLP